MDHIVLNVEDNENMFRISLKVLMLAPKLLEEYSEKKTAWC